uniref:Uncharacterized protein n=1 Tax=Panagrolaimus sp. PS1159 TaxID=55785 RepID=A0AC35FZF7_9BILA
MIRWIYLTKLSSSRTSYITRYLKVDKEDMFLFREYCDKIINADGVIVLKMIGDHSNELFSKEILMTLWNKFKESVKLNNIVITTPVGSQFDNNSSNHRPMNLFQRTLSVMGAHVQVPISESHMGTRHRDVSITLPPQLNFDDAETAENDTPLLRS